MRYLLNLLFAMVSITVLDTLVSSSLSPYTTNIGILSSRISTATIVVMVL